VTKCPKCGSQKLQSLGIEHGERQDDYHSILVSKLRCKACGLEFREIEVAEWYTEIPGREIQEDTLWYEATIRQQLTNNRHREKRVRFKVADRSRRTFFQRHPEFRGRENFVTVVPSST